MQTRIRDRSWYIWLGCIVALLAGGAFGTWGIQRLWLSQPVFIKSHETLSLTDQQVEPMYDGVEQNFLLREGALRLLYITNAFEEVRVKSVSFKEAPELSFKVKENVSGGWSFDFSGKRAMEPGRRAGRYSLRTVELDLLDDAAARAFAAGNKPLELNRAVIELEQKNGAVGQNVSMEADLGRILLLPAGAVGEEIFEKEGGGSSSDGDFHTEFSVKKELTILSIEESLVKDYNKESGNTYTLLLDETPLHQIKNMKVKPGQHCTLSGTLKTGGKGSWRLMPLSTALTIAYEDRNGLRETQVIPVYIADGGLYWDVKFKEVHEYLKDQGVV